MDCRLFMKRENRDKRYYELVKEYGREHVYRSVTTNQQLHPMYVGDWEGPLDTGFGNTQYRTFFSKLYVVDVR